MVVFFSRLVVWNQTYELKQIPLKFQCFSFVVYFYLNSVYENVKLSKCKLKTKTKKCHQNITKTVHKNVTPPKCSKNSLKKSDLTVHDPMNVLSFINEQNTESNLNPSFEGKIITPLS